MEGMANSWNPQCTEKNGLAVLFGLSCFRVVSGEL